MRPFGEGSIEQRIAALERTVMVLASLVTDEQLEQVSGSAFIIEAREAHRDSIRDQIEGFTWEDVDRLRKYEDESRNTWHGRSEDAEWLSSLAGRIAALLPPRQDRGS